MKLTIKMLEKANLSKFHFCRLININRDSLGRYFSKRNQSDDIVAKIEFGAKALKESELVWPNINHVPTEKGHKEYLKNKKKSDSLDKKLATALKKAMK